VNGTKSKIPEEPSVRASALTKTFERRSLFAKGKTFVHAVRGVSFTIPKGKTLGLMGESGCGKTTTGLLILRLVEATSGEATVCGHHVMALDKSGLKRFRRDAQIILQNPKEALDLRRKVRSSILEPLLVHGLLEERRGALPELARRVGLQEQHLSAFPNALSGGAQQRVCICRALILEPGFLVLDEPTSALDVSVQARVLELLVSLQKERELTYLFISHDASVLRYICDWIGVMYLGEIVEYGRVDKVFGNPLHPYTRALCGSVLTTERELDRLTPPLVGSPPSPSNLPEGCAFRGRCKEKNEECRGYVPTLVEVEPEHSLACHLQRMKAASPGEGPRFGNASEGRGGDDRC
jgi:oligopeptide/dipeptide ABC transporter ATP-binding protein